MHALFLSIGAFALLVVWLGPLPAFAERSFAAHMAMHMTVVAVAAPLIAVGVAGTRVDPARAMPRFFAPIPASIIELVVVWAWHAPALHQAARHNPAVLALEQFSFLAAGLLLWIAAVGGSREQRRFRHGAGIVALLFTSMHMTLLGALFALAPRLLYTHRPTRADAIGALADQHLGGVIMLLVGAASYLAGGLWLTGNLLASARSRRPSHIQVPKCEVSS